VAPYVFKALAYGITPTQVTIASIVFGLLTALLVLENLVIIAGLFMILTGLVSFAKGTLARNTKLMTNLDSLYDTLADTLVDGIVLFSLIAYYYPKNYVMMLLTVLLLVMLILNKEIVYLKKVLRVKKIDPLPYRYEIMTFLALGLLFNQITLFVVASIALSGVNMTAFLLHLHQLRYPKSKNTKTAKPKKS
jgi:phosphatidylglycerophosphate synthase